MPAQFTEELKATGLYKENWVAVGSANGDTSRCAGVDALVVDSMGPRSEGLYICSGMCLFFPSSNLLSVINNAPERQAPVPLETSTTDLTRCSQGQSDLRLPWKTGYSSLQRFSTI